jgi:hypothetical protein
LGDRQPSSIDSTIDSRKLNPFHDIANDLRRTVTCPVLPNSDHINVPAELNRLLHNDGWLNQDWEFVDRISKKLDTNRRIHESYTRRWAVESKDEIGEPWRSVCALLLCKAFLIQFDEEPHSPLVLKRLNVAHKAIDYLAETDPEVAQKITEALKGAGFEFENKTIETTTINGSYAVEHVDAILPLTVLFWEGPIARAFLETIASLGVQPRKIIHLASSIDIATGRHNAKWLPTILRKPIAASMQRSRIFHWPNAMARRYPHVLSAIFREVATNLDFTENTLRQAQFNKPLSEYSRLVDTLLVEDLKDPILLDYLANEVDREFLFTGGGIVPASLLALSDSRFLHIHPGYLPDIRGADGLLWSLLTAGRPSASAFYMDPGIDTGDILLARWLPKLQVSIVENLDILTRYRMTYAFIDPWVRCYMLRELIAGNTEFNDVAALGQNEEDGATFHFMHDQLRRIALDKLYNCDVVNSG